MDVIERPFSDLLRQPNDVVAELEEHDVVLRRRNAPALRLSRETRQQDRGQAFESLARLLRNLALHSPAAFDLAAEDGFPWFAFLPDSERKLFVTELTRTLVASATVDSFAPVAQILQEWKATAKIHADPHLAEHLNQPLDTDGGQIPAPT